MSTMKEELLAELQHDEDIARAKRLSNKKDWYHNKGGKEKVAGYNVKHRTATNANATKRGKMYKARLVEEFGNQCLDCKQTYIQDVYNFHHLDPSEKAGVINLSLSWERIKQEADKCVMLCANCHIIRHSKQRVG
jgi:hypothetical protein